MTRLRLESCESGLERFAALELIRIARRLAVEPQFFFNGLPGRETAHEVPLLLLAGMVVVSSNDNLAARRGDEDQNPLRVHR